MFARAIARKPGRYQQVAEAVPAAATAEAAAATIAARVEQLVLDPQIVAAALVLPHIVSLEELARVAVALNGQARWSVRTTLLSETPIGEMVAVHVAREVPFGEGWCPSEVLILGPIAEFPATRRSPVTALEIFVGNPLPADPKTGAATIKTNLAHMDLPWTDEVFQDVWTKSQQGRLASLGCDDPRAKAKVSFVMPMELAQKLDCLP